MRPTRNGAACAMAGRARAVAAVATAVRPRARRLRVGEALLMEVSCSAAIAAFKVIVECTMVRTASNASWSDLFGLASGRGCALNVPSWPSGVLQILGCNAVGRRRAKEGRYFVRGRSL